MKDDTHERILEGATELIATRGYRPGRIEEIAEFIGVSVKTIYNHFGSKRALVVAVVQRNLDALFTQFNEVLDREDLSFAEKVHGIVTVGAERARLRKPGQFRMVGVDEPSIAQQIRPQLRERLRGVFARLWEEGRAAGALAADLDGETVTYALLFLIEGYLSLSREEPALAPRDELLRGAINAHLFGILTPQARQEASTLLRGETADV
jgi:AcrR family transcriptional regulator